MIKRTRDEAIELGLKRYFTGEACVNGHVAERFISRKCCECAKLQNGRNADWRRAHRAKNRDRLIESQRGYYSKNKDRLKADKKSRRSSDIEAARAREQAYRHARKAAYQEHAKAWRIRNPEKYRANASAARAKRRGARAKFSGEELALISAMQKGRCAYCRTPIDMSTMHVDHIQPISKGGDHHRRNIQILCAPCNLSKRDRDPLYHARRLGRLL